MSFTAKFACIVYSVLIIAMLSGVACAVQDDETEYFERHVRPLIVSKCFSCHSEKKQESDLRLDARSAILIGGASGDPAAIAGDPDASLILQYTRREVEGMEMPPDNPLSDDEIAVLQRWVERGLKWPDASTGAVATMDERFARDRSTHWAFQTPRVERPSHATWPRQLQRWPKSQLDEFVADKLAANDMTPSNEADHRTILRRVKFDLLGLPPTSEEVAAFVSDTTPDAYEQLVERLLASPNYGERWGRHWLDVARYADTSGYTFGGADRNYAWAYTYRDYVIGAFNQDLPYDQFVIQQLAADKLDMGGDNRALAALGFLTVGRKFNNRHDDIDDRIDAVTRGFVGLTVACARCHDHKYDAIPTEDYYSLYGVFASSHESSPPLIGDADTLAAARNYEQRYKAVNDALTKFDSHSYDKITNEAHTKVTDYLLVVATKQQPEQLPNDLRSYLVKEWRNLIKRKARADSPTLMPWFKLMSVADEEFAAAAHQLSIELKGETGEFLNPFIRDAFTNSPPTSKEELAKLFGCVLLTARQTWQDAGGNDSARRKQPPEVRQLLWYFFDGTAAANIEKDNLQRYLTDAEKEERESFVRAVAQVKKTQPVAYHRAMVMTDKGSPGNARVFVRGDAARKGDKVPRRSPQLLSATATSPAYQSGSGRMELARDIIRPGNPLAARVFVNRVWMHHFGKPLVDTPSDFGIRCEPPQYQKLLDYLACLLVQNKWSVKALHREILLSATYRQSSQDRPECYSVDPENRLLWRMNRRRLEFEALRDALLAVGGQLDPSVGGKSVRQFRRRGGGNRRSVYGYIDRQDLPNVLRVFDFAGPDASAEKRANTVVPQQALFMLNSPFVIKQARSLLRQVWRKGNASTNAQLVDALYEHVLTRKPSEDERQVAMEFLSSDKKHENQLTPPQQLAQLLLLTNEFCYVD